MASAALLEQSDLFLTHRELRRMQDGTLLARIRDALRSETGSEAPPRRERLADELTPEAFITHSSPSPTDLWSLRFERTALEALQALPLATGLTPAAPAGSPALP